MAKYMGHKDATITLAIYAQLWDEDAGTDAEKLARPTALLSNVTAIDSQRTG